jgi:2-phosphoglycerate kinase
MAKKDEPGAGGESAPDRVMVGRKGAGRPFMRGIMVHSLTSRGISFDEAYRTAVAVRERIKGRKLVSRAELAELVIEDLGEKALADAAVPLPTAIQVGTAKSSSPFSKGTLAQSLLAASIDPTDAFDVAREIEAALVLKKVERISRRGLRKRSYEALRLRFGDATAERYLVWRKYQEPERPVIILIGGTTGAGKTSVALEVARRLGVRRVMSTDSIRQVMRIMLSHELMPAIHYSSFDAHHHIPNSGLGEDPVIEGCIAQASVVAVGVRAMIERAIAENTSLVLDGVTLMPGVIDLSDYKDVADVIFLVLATLDPASFQSRFESRGRRQSKRGKHRYIENLDAILRIQEHFLEYADRFDVPIVDNSSLDDSVKSIIRQVVEMLRSRGELDTSELL